MKKKENETAMIVQIDTIEEYLARMTGQVNILVSDFIQNGKKNTSESDMIVNNGQMKAPQSPCHE